MENITGATQSPGHKEVLADKAQTSANQSRDHADETIDNNAATATVGQTVGDVKEKGAEAGVEIKKTNQGDNGDQN
jgi:hypothetical protein